VNKLPSRKGVEKRGGEGKSRGRTSTWSLLVSSVNASRSKTFTGGGEMGLRVYREGCDSLHVFISPDVLVQGGKEVGSRGRGLGRKNPVGVSWSNKASRVRHDCEGDTTRSLDRRGPGRDWGLGRGERIRKRKPGLVIYMRRVGARKRHPPGRCLDAAMWQGRCLVIVEEEELTGSGEGHARKKKRERKRQRKNFGESLAERMPPVTGPNLS